MLTLLCLFGGCHSSIAIVYVTWAHTQKDGNVYPTMLSDLVSEATFLIDVYLLLYGNMMTRIILSNCVFENIVNNVSYVKS